MTIDTPDWVRDAVFYQIFPDRFAASARVPKPGPLEPWDAPADVPRLQGRRPARRRRAPRLPRRPGRQRDLLHADLPVGLEPPLPHVRLLPVDPLLGGNAALRRAARRGPRAGHAGRARRRLQPRQPRLLARSTTSWRTALDSPYLDWFHSTRRPGSRQVGVSGTPGGLGLTERPGPPEAGPGQLGYEAWWDLPALPKFNTDNPAGPRVPAAASPSTGSASASTAGGSTCRRRSTTTAFWREFRRRVPRRQPRGVHRRRDLGRSARSWLQGDSSTR